MPSRDITERQIVMGRSRGHCAVLCGWEPLCQGFDSAVVNKTMLCHLAVGEVDASPLDKNWPQTNGMDHWLRLYFEEMVYNSFYSRCVETNHTSDYLKYMEVII